jgi:hypothetical protein
MSGRKQVAGADKELRTARQIEVESRREDVRIKRARRRLIEQQHTFRAVTFVVGVILLIGAMVAALADHTAVAGGSTLLGVLGIINGCLRPRG